MSSQVARLHLGLPRFSKPGTDSAVEGGFDAGIYDVQERHRDGEAEYVSLATPTDRILTLESNSTYRLNGVGFRSLGNLRTTDRDAADDELLFFAVDVGQGDATIVAGPVLSDRTRKVAVIDAGDRRPDGGKIIAEVLDSFGADSVSHVVLTHYDGDHMGKFVTISNSTSLLWGENCMPEPCLLMSVLRRRTPGPLRNG